MGEQEITTRKIDTNCFCTCCLSSPIVRNNIIWQGNGVVSGIEILAHINKDILNSILNHDWIVCSSTTGSVRGLDPWNCERFKYPRVERYHLTTWAHHKI